MRVFVRSFAFQVALGLATVVIAVASNQLLTDDGWNWWWTTGTVLAVLVLAAMTALANYLTSAPEVSAAAPAFVPVLDDAHGVPRPSAHFVGRSEDLGWLHDTLSRPGTVAVLHGLGGIGKTAVAAQYAHEAADTHRLVLWVSAETDTTLNEGLATAAGRLGVVSTPGMSRPGFDGDIEDPEDWELCRHHGSTPTSCVSVQRVWRSRRGRTPSRVSGR